MSPLSGKKKNSNHPKTTTKKIFEHFKNANVPFMTKFYKTSLEHNIKIDLRLKLIFSSQVELECVIMQFNAM